MFVNLDVLLYLFEIANKILYRWPCTTFPSQVPNMRKTISFSCFLLVHFYIIQVNQVPYAHYEASRYRKNSLASFLDNASGIGGDIRSSSEACDRHSLIHFLLGTGCSDRLVLLLRIGSHRRLGVRDELLKNLIAMQLHAVGLPPVRVFICMLQAIRIHDW